MATMMRVEWLRPAEADGSAGNGSGLEVHLVLKLDLELADLELDFQFAQGGPRHLRESACPLWTPNGMTVVTGHLGF